MDLGGSEGMKGGERRGRDWIEIRGWWRILRDRMDFCSGGLMIPPVKIYFCMQIS